MAAKATETKDHLGDLVDIEITMNFTSGVASTLVVKREQIDCFKTRASLYGHNGITERDMYLEWTEKERKS